VASTGARRFASVSRALDRLTDVSLWVSGAALALLLGCYVYEVATRYFFNAPTTWSYDVSQWLFCLSVVLALPQVTRKGAHVAITILVDRLPAVPRDWARRALLLTGVAACAVTAWICAQEAHRQWSLGIVTLWNHPVPKWWVSAAIPVGFLLSGLNFLRASLGCRRHAEGG